MSGLEVVGLAIGALHLPVALVQWTERIIKALRDSKGSKSGLHRLVLELETLKTVLLRVRDIFERQATDEADAGILSALLGPMRELEDTLNNLQMVTIMGRSFFHNGLHINVQQQIGKFAEGILASRLRICLLLDISPSGTQTEHFSFETTTVINYGDSELVANWLDSLHSDEKLEQLQGQLHPGAGRWLLVDPMFIDWEESVGRTLWCSGLPGSGKTVLSSMVVGHLRGKYHPTKAPVIFTSPDHTNSAKHSPDNIIGSLLAQLIRQSRHVSSDLEVLYNRYAPSHYPALEYLWSILCSTISSFDRVFIVLDALDEYTMGTKGFLDDFRKLFEQSKANLFVTSRPTSANKAVLIRYAELEIRANDDHLKEYLRQQLLNTRAHKLEKQPVLRDEIMELINRKANGSFLLAQLLLESVLSQPTIKAMKREISIDYSVESLYDTMMERLQSFSSSQSRRALALEALSWLAYAITPLTVGQLLEAVGIQMGSEELDTDELPFMSELKDNCAGLIFIDTTRQQVSLIHYSLNRYLRLYLPRFKHLLPWSVDPDAFIAKKCLTCLRFRSFSLAAPSDIADLGDRLEKYAMLGYAARHWGDHARHVPLENIKDEIMSLYGSTNNLAAAGLIMLIYEQHPGHYEQAYRGMMGLHISAHFGLDNLVEHMVETQGVHPETVTVGGWTALHWAARQGHTATVETLLRVGASTRAITILDGWNALHLAAKEGHFVIVMLIVSEVDINATDVQQRTALYLATWAGHTDIAQYLLQQGADPSVPREYGATALHCAAKRGHGAIVRHLLDGGADVNAEDSVGLTALDEATRKRNGTIMSMLVKAGAHSERSNLDSGSYIVEDYDWETYKINDQDTSRTGNAGQCVCHVLEKSVQGVTTQRTLKVFRKTYSLSKDGDGKVRKYFGSERRILERLTHPNVVKYLDIDEDPDQNALLLYTEYCDLGDLNTCYGRPLVTSTIDDEDDNYGFYPEDPTSERSKMPVCGADFWVLVAELSSALAYLHYGLATKNTEEKWTASFERSWFSVIHRDIKPANVVLKRSDSGNCVFKLCDLGIASEAGKGPGYNTTRIIGTDGFKPPELSKQGWTRKGDIWAFGETLREMSKLKDLTFEDSIKQLIDSCTAKFPKSRPNSLRIMEQAYSNLEELGLLVTLSTRSRLQIQATYALLGAETGGYLLKAFYLVAELLDDIEPLGDANARKHRKDTLRRLRDLWEDGVEKLFLKHPKEFSLHALALLDLPGADRTKYFNELVISQPDVNKQWRQSRWTPLHLAAQTRNMDLVERLLVLGANKDRLDLHGRTPSFYVDSAEHPSLFTLLKPTTKHANSVANETEAHLRMRMTSLRV